MTPAALTFFQPLVIVFLTVVIVTGSGMAVASHWCPVLGIVGWAMTAGAGVGWTAVDAFTHDWLGAAVGAALFTFGAVNLWRVDQFARRSAAGATS